MSFIPSLLDRLTEPAAGARPRDAGVAATLTLEELKRSVAHDVQALLNTRCILDAQQFIADGQPDVARSVVLYGLNDFSWMSVADVSNREAILRGIEEAIEAHEPRLRRVHAKFPDKATGTALRFLISAQLLTQPAAEPVSFQAMLQPDSQRYTVDASGRPAQGSPQAVP